MRKKKLKLKKNVLSIFKIFGFLVGLCSIILFIFYRQVVSLTNLGYSKNSSINIIFSGNKKYVLSVGENKTLNAAFDSENYNEKYLNNYTKIKFQNHKNLIRNINLLLDKGYSNNDVSIILEHGTDEEVYEFSKRDRVKYLEEFYSYPYAKLSNYDRYLAYSDSTGEDEKTSVIHVNLNMDKEAHTDAILVENFSYDMLVNKYHYVDDKFTPDDLIEISTDYASDEGMFANKIAVNAFIQMSKSAALDGYEIVINSAYRSYNDQVETINYYKKWYGQSYVDNYVAKPGFSEHQTGLAFDIGSKSSKVFAQSKEYDWMLENAHKYGFILRFYKKVEHITGYKSEPWHYRYVGKEIASYIHKNNITYEEYYVMFLDK